jgi:hypothetical protein
VSAVLVLHALGDPEGGASWRASGANAPDLPGHGGEPAPTGGAYDIADAVVAVAPLVDSEDPPVIVGHGCSARAAEIFAVGGRASRVVLVDGLGGAQKDAAAVMSGLFTWVRAMREDAAAMAPPPTSGLDPRLRHGVPDEPHARFDADLRAAITVPVLVLESPASPTSSEDRVARTAAFGGDVEIQEVPDASPKTILAAVERWLGD